jgi:hypothetical protein
MKKTNKRLLILAPIMLIPIIVIFLLVLPYIVSPIINDISLNSFSGQINKYALPQNTEIIEKKQVCGKLNGNGNGMDFFACILIKSDLPLDDIKQYYKAIAFKPAKSIEANSEHIVDIDVVQSKGYRLQTEYVERDEVDFASLKNVTDFSKYFLVMIYDGGYSANFDLRGH